LRTHRPCVHVYVSEMHPGYAHTLPSGLHA